MTYIVLMMQDNEYDYRDIAKSYFSVVMPDDIRGVAVEDVVESVVSLDLSHPDEILMRCKVPFMRNTMIDGKFRMEYGSYDCNALIGKYESPFKILEYSRTGEVTRVRSFGNPEFQIAKNQYSKDTDVVFLIKYKYEFSEK